MTKADDVGEALKQALREMLRNDDDEKWKQFREWVRRGGRNDV